MKIMKGRKFSDLSNAMIGSAIEVHKTQGLNCLFYGIINKTHIVMQKYLQVLQKLGSLPYSAQILNRNRYWVTIPKDAVNPSHK